MIDIIEHSHWTATADIAIELMKETNMAASHASKNREKAKIPLRPPLQKLAKLSYDSTPSVHSSPIANLVAPLKEGLPNPFTLCRRAFGLHFFGLVECIHGFESVQRQKYRF